MRASACPLAIAVNASTKSFALISAELLYSRRLCVRHKRPVIDVTRSSIEEIAATIIRLPHDLTA